MRLLGLAFVLYLAFFITAILQFGIEVAVIVLAPVAVIVVVFAFIPNLQFVSVLMFLFWVGFEGLLKRITNYDWWPYLVRDALLASIYIGYLAFRNTRGRRPSTPVDKPLKWFIVLGLIECLNPALPGPMTGLLGIHSRFASMPLFFVVLHLVESRQQVRQLLIMGTMIGLFTAVGTLIESSLGYEYMRSMGPGWLPSGAPHWWDKDMNIIIRPQSIAQNPGGAGYMETIALFLVIALFFSSIGFSTKLVLTFCLPIYAIAIVLHVTRIIYAVPIIGLPLLAIVTLRRSRGTVIPLVAAFLGVYGLFRLTTTRVFERAESTNALAFREERLSSLTPIGVEMLSKPLGMGIGLSSPGGRFFVGDYGSFGVGYHNYLTTLVVEMGIPGLIVYLWLAATIAIGGYRQVKALKDHELRNIGWTLYSLLFAVLLHTAIGGALDGYPLEDYTWLLAGAMFGLIRMAGFPPKLGRE